MEQQSTRKFGEIKWNSDGKLKEHDVKNTQISVEFNLLMEGLKTYTSEQRTIIDEVRSENAAKLEVM